MKRLLLAAALLAATVAAPSTATAWDRCVRTPNGFYEVCVLRGECTVYVWATMPPALCL